MSFLDASDDDTSVHSSHGMLFDQLSSTTLSMASFAVGPYLEAPCDYEFIPFEELEFIFD